MVEPSSDALFRKIEALLRLTKSPNESEATAAAAKVQELLLKYNLELADLPTAEGERRRQTLGEERVELGGVESWRSELLHTLALGHLCRSIYWTGSTKSSLLGAAHNIQVVRYLYDYLERELSREMRRKRWTQRKVMRSRTVWERSFFDGAISHIRTRLEAQKSPEAAGARLYALVVQTDQELDAAFEKRFPNSRSRRSAARSWDRNGYEAGHAAGGNVSLTPPLAGRQRRTPVLAG